MVLRIANFFAFRMSASSTILTITSLKLAMEASAPALKKERKPNVKQLFAIPLKMNNTEKNVKIKSMKPTNPVSVLTKDVKVKTKRETIVLS